MKSRIGRQIHGNWHVVIGKLKQGCGKFRHDAPKIVEGKKEELRGRLEKRTRMTATQICRFIKTLPPSSSM